MPMHDRLLLAILLSQAGEFAFVIFQFARTEGNFTSVDFDLLKAHLRELSNAAD